MLNAPFYGSRARSAALAASLAFAACSSRPRLEPLTAVDVNGAVGLFAVTNPGPFETWYQVTNPGASVTWYQLLPDGTFRRAATQGTVVPVVLPGQGGTSVESAITIPVPIEMYKLSNDLVLIRFASAATSDPLQAYLQEGLVLDVRTGRLDDGWPGAGYLTCGGIPACTWPAWTAQPLADGTLAVLPFQQQGYGFANPVVVTAGTVSSASLKDSAWVLGSPLMPASRQTDWFAVDAAGNLAIRGPVSGGPPTFIPAVGPMVESPVSGAFGDFWTGLDGAIRSTRAVGDAAGTVELVRFDFSPAGEITATSTAAWTGTGVLTGWPIAMGTSTVFMVGTQPLVFDAPDAAPTLHPPLSVNWIQLQATDHALWFTAGTIDSSYLVRWTPAGTSELRPAAPWTYREVFPVSDDDVLIGAWNPIELKAAVLRSNGTTAPSPVDLGPSPFLRGHLRWK